MSSLRRTAMLAELGPFLLAWALVNAVLLGTWALSIDLSQRLADLLYSFLLVNVVVGASAALVGVRTVRRVKMLRSLPDPPIAFEEPDERSIPDDWVVRFALSRDQRHAEVAQAREVAVEEDIEFFGAWIHELKTPISVLRLVADKGDHPEAAEITRQIDRLEQHASRAMYHLRSSSLSHDMVISPVSIEPLLKERVRGMARSFIDKRIGVTVEGDFEEVSSDRKWLSFVIDQILQNAHRYTKPGGSLAILGVLEPAGPRVEIHDTGIGIPAEDLPRVFDRSFTGSHGREFGSSTGMGLYLARKMVLRLGHRISVDSPSDRWDPPRGTVVSVRFPKWDGAVAGNLTET
ncbi:MAG: sensor histidine kinase [Spirochaetales bacterium]